VVPHLTAVLPGIDSNDPHKTMLVFQLFSIYARLIPLSDMTGHAASAELTVEERKICQQSSKLQTFLLNFMDQCFKLIENSTSDQI
jgi:proteasome activator subunit 4